MNKIYIHKGDSTIFADVTKFLTFVLITELDLTGWSATFQLANITRVIEDITSKKFEIILTADETKSLFLGDIYGSLILKDFNSNIKTISNTIPFCVTSKVIENTSETIDLNIPDSAEINISVKVGANTVTSINGMTGDVILEVPDINNFATKIELNKKQDKGDYALKSDLNTLATKEEIPTLVSELENDSDFATQLQVMQAIASIPQFKLSIVDELPMTGEKMTLYFLPKEGAENDIYNEYVWIEQTGSYEFLGSTAVDLTDYVKKTDYASKDTYGVVKVVPNGTYGIGFNDSAGLFLVSANESQITAKTNSNKAITPKILDYAVKTGVTTNTIELTDDEKTSACNWLGTVKTVALTQAEYDALETKDETTLYMIKE